MNLLWEKNKVEKLNLQVKKRTRNYKKGRMYKFGRTKCKTFSTLIEI